MTSAPRSLSAVTAAYRQALLEHDATILKQTQERWVTIQRALQVDTDRLLKRIAEAQASGVDIKMSWLQKEQRYQDFLSQVEAQVSRYALSLEPVIVAQQQATAALAVDHAAGLIEAQIGDRVPFNRLPVEAVNELIGTLQDGSPLKDYLAQFGAEAATAAEEALIAGVATGANPKVIAAELSKLFGARNAADPGAIGRKALITARQSVLGAYRSASLESYKQNSDVVSGWVWVSALQPSRTCSVCWAMHGSEHDLSEPFVSHVGGCRCTPVPRTKTGLPGVPETRLEVPRGEDLFAKLPADAQRLVLGPGRMAVWESGVPLASMIATQTDDRWGPSLREKPLSELT